MNCPFCGTALRADARFCPQCGQASGPRAEDAGRAVDLPVDALASTAAPGDEVLASAIAEGLRRAQEIQEQRASAAPPPLSGPAESAWGETVPQVTTAAPSDARPRVSPLAGSHLNLRALLDSAEGTPQRLVPVEVPRAEEPARGRSGTAVMEARPEPSVIPSQPSQPPQPSQPSSSSRAVYSPTTPLPIVAPPARGSGPQVPVAAGSEPQPRGPGSVAAASYGAPAASYVAPPAASYGPSGYGAPGTYPPPGYPAPVVDAFAVGRAVVVLWSNGQRYPATVLQASPTHLLVAFGDGQRHWVERSYVAAS